MPARLCRDTLFVRAARKVAAGSELTVSYLPVGGGADTSVFGSEAGAAADDDGEGAAAEYEGGSGGRGTLLSPVEVRRAALEDSYGFVCGCGRCTTEEGLVSEVLGRSNEPRRGGFGKIDLEDFTCVFDGHIPNSCVVWRAMR